MVPGKTQAGPHMSHPPPAPTQPPSLSLKHCPRCIPPWDICRLVASRNSRLNWNAGIHGCLWLLQPTLATVIESHLALGCVTAQVCEEGGWGWRTLGHASPFFLCCFAFCFLSTELLEAHLLHLTTPMLGRERLGIRRLHSNRFRDSDQLFCLPGVCSLLSATVPRRTVVQLLLLGFPIKDEKLGETRHSLLFL